MNGCYGSIFSTNVLATTQPLLCIWLGERDFTMIWAAFTLAFFAFLWCSEFTYPGTKQFRSFHLRGPLYSFQSGCLLTWSTIVHLLRDAAHHASLPYKSLKGHSFCIGTASTAAVAGLPDWLIKVLRRTPCNILLLLRHVWLLSPYHRLIKLSILCLGDTCSTNTCSTCISGS